MVEAESSIHADGAAADVRPIRVTGKISAAQQGPDAMADKSTESDAEAISEVQLLLSELRTALSLMRTGIAILALPLSVFSVLVATSRYYDALNVLGFLAPLAALCAVLIVFGGYLIAHSWRKVRRIDRLIHRIKMEHSVLAKYIESID